MTGGDTTENPYTTAILDAARACFARNGFHGTSMRDIAAEVGINAGSLYTHIKSKDDLLFQIVDGTAREATQHIETVLKDEDDPIEKLTTVAGAHLRWMSENPDSWTVYSREWQHLKSPRYEEVRRARQRWTRGLRAIIQQGVDQGCFRPIDVRLGGVAFVSMLDTVNGWLRPGRPPKATEVAATFTDFLINGWRPR